jgi:hypothetical protein
MAFKDKAKTISYNNEYNKGAYDRISLMLPKKRVDEDGNLISEGKKDKILEAIKKTGDKSVNAFIIRAIDLLLEQTEEQN